MHYIHHFMYISVGGGAAAMSLASGELSGMGVGENTSSPSLSPAEGKSETSDEWMDVSDSETDTSTGPPISITTRIPV